MNKETVEEALEEHGEIHIVVEEHDSVMVDMEEDYIGIRNADYCELQEDVIHVDDGATQHYIPYDRIVYMQKPVNFPD